MITGTIKSQIDQIWNAFWSGGVSNPLSVIEQLTFLMFIKRLDDLHTVEERKSEDLGIPMARRIFPEGANNKGEPYDNLRWSRFKHFEAREMMRIVDEHVFPFLRQLGEVGSSYGTHMKDARLGFSNANLLAKIVQMLDDIPMVDRDTKGDVYEYMLGKIASAGTNGQFRTPRHIIALMVNIMKPQPGDTICDPAAGTCGFLVAAGEYLREHHPEMLRNKEQRDHFHRTMFHGFDFDATMLRIGAMNMTLHGVDSADVSYRDSLAEEHGADAGAYSLILANPPFAGSLDYDTTAKNLLKIVKTKKTELLFIALFLRQLRVGGRAAVVVPDGVLFGSSKAHKDIRRMLVEDHKLDAIIKLPSGVFRPYAGVSCAVVVFTKTGVGGTEGLWFYDMTADGFSLDDKRTPLLEAEKLGACPTQALTAEEHAKNNLPDILARWGNWEAEAARPRTAQSFVVSAEDIISTGSWDLSLNRYKEVEHEEVAHAAPAEIIAELRVLEAEIAEGLDWLEGMLG
ncbi:type I restriction-modification system subunit M [Allosediminivita pacifica]|uniref:site-specific DNA-methyltransferase (adenine-specific) n=1 Tax=Allosediminivita pacifica TaxID=1267769 RepID=A0A2T6ACL9_9RHOB|nr:class I SAM-dependent DNA methyltransferase [Allosediminivita pacifica]PTX41564.1 type I restriction enzyme M protein [Allosediminivita pacifica]GGB22972.1 DNA methyltransferase [Allosediminivita pacifica]